MLSVPYKRTRFWLAATDKLFILTTTWISGVLHNICQKKTHACIALMHRKEQKPLILKLINC